MALVGAGLAGRRTSLSLVLSRHGRTGGERVFDNADRFGVFEGTPFVAFVASLRSQYADPDAPGISEELQRVLSSDGILFVVDSQRERVAAGIHQLERLRDDMTDAGASLDERTVVFQLNKRDLANALPVAELRELFQTVGCRYSESAASLGIGAAESFESLVALIAERSR